MDSKKGIDTVINTIMEAKKELQKFVKEENLEKVQASVNKFVKNAQRDISKVVDTDLAFLKKKFNQEKTHIEKAVEKAVHIEIEKAKKFVNKQKAEIAKLQHKIEKQIAETVGTRKKVFTKPTSTTTKGTYKKTSKKVAPRPSTKKSVSKVSHKPARSQVIKRATRR